MTKKLIILASVVTNTIVSLWTSDSRPHNQKTFLVLPFFVKVKFYLLLSQRCSRYVMNQKYHFTKVKYTNFKYINFFVTALLDNDHEANCNGRCCYQYQRMSLNNRLLPPEMKHFSGSSLFSSYLVNLFFVIITKMFKIYQKSEISLH